MIKVDNKLTFKDAQDVLAAFKQALINGKSSIKINGEKFIIVNEDFGFKRTDLNE